jgi:hypothetical protein
MTLSVLLVHGVETVEVVVLRNLANLCWADKA